MIHNGPAFAGARTRQRLGVGRAERLVGICAGPRQVRGFAVHSKQRFRRYRCSTKKRRRVDKEKYVDESRDPRTSRKSIGIGSKPFTGSSKYMILTIAR